MRIPSQQECYRLIDEMKMLSHIVAHSHQVCRVADFLAGCMEQKGVCLNRELIRASALLHDITKTRSFDTREDHVRTGAQLMFEMGYHEVGRIVDQHVRLNVYSDSLPTEAEIINYADKRVLHDRVAPLEERMRYIMEKYARDIERQRLLRWLWRKTVELETKLFKYLSFPPNELKERLNNCRPVSKSGSSSN